MAIINLHLDLDENYKNFIKDIYKIFVILFVIQIILNFGDVKKDFFINALSGNLFNDDFAALIFVIILGISSYYLIFNRILEIQ